MIFTMDWSGRTDVLHPEERQSLTEALRPPAGWKLDFALGTTYSLDLMTLLTVPLSFTFFDVEDHEGRPIADPLRVMEALRRYAHRIHVFCDAGRIAFSRTNRQLNVFIESAVHPVKAPRGGAFHPKLWALRFADGEGHLMYRLLVSSRNLTYDRSWDTILCLEGEVVDRTNAFGINHPLGNLIDALPDMCLYPLDATMRVEIGRVQHELRRTRFTSPEGLELQAFLAMGFEGENTPDFTGTATALTVISPFVSEIFLRNIVHGTSRRSYLLSRRESLDQVSDEVLDAFTKTYVMDDAVETEMLAEDGEEEQSENRLVGLHAKCYIIESEFKALILTGSANATNAAFSKNVELLVALEGGYRNSGAFALFGTAESPSDFMKLLKPYVRSGEPVPPDEGEAAFEFLRDAVIGALTERSLRAVCELQPDGFHTLTLFGDMTLDRELADSAMLSVRPLSLDEQFSQSVTPGAALHVVFRGLSFIAITSFFVFELRWNTSGREFVQRFVLNVPLAGAPTDRIERVMADLLKDQRQVMRLLLMILGILDPTEIARSGDAPYIDHGWQKLVAGDDSRPLFELLVCAASRNPEKIADIDGIVTALRKAENGTPLLPEGFDEIWLPVKEAARSGRKK